MKRISVLLFCILFLTGCDNPFVSKEESEEMDYTITAYTVDQLEDDCYYIKHGEEYYPIVHGDNTMYENEELGLEYQELEDSNTQNPLKSYFYTKDKEELMIPTMYQDDELIYKSSTSSLEGVQEWERFVDGGYTVGIRAFQKSENNTYYVSNYQANILQKSVFEEKLGRVEKMDANGEGIHAYQFYTLGAINGKGITADDINQDGMFFKNLNPNETYTIDVYQGTTCIPIQTKPDVRIFYNFENYYTKGLNYSNQGYVSLYIPKAFKSGYYKTGMSGMFRYVDMPYEKAKDLSGINFNDPFFEKDENGYNIETYLNEDEESVYVYDTGVKEEEQEEKTPESYAITSAAITSAAVTE